jgi:hypothetical protein
MKIKINYRKELFKGYSGLCESIFCAPFEDIKKFQEEKFENDRFKKIIEFGSDYLELTDINECDYVIIPYKWDNYSNNSKMIIEEARKFNKKVITLHNDDMYPQIPINEQDGYLFTTTLDMNTRRNNEFSFPAFTGDYFDEYNKYNFNRKLGFCGAITNTLRGEVLQILSNSTKIETNFIIRSGFWAPELTKDIAREQFVENLKNNTFILCVRGAGNFSYRLYETLMMGRIPIIINSNQVLPFEDIIDYSTFSIRLQYDNLIEDGLNNIIKSISDSDISMMQNNARIIWEEYLSPLGWLKNFNREICKI